MRMGKKSKRARVKMGLHSSLVLPKGPVQQSWAIWLRACIGSCGLQRQCPYDLIPPDRGLLGAARATERCPGMLGLFFLPAGPAPLEQIVSLKQIVSVLLDQIILLK